MVGIARGEDLRFGFEAAKGARVNDAVAVAGVGGAIGMVGFGKRRPRESETCMAYGAREDSREEGAAMRGFYDREWRGGKMDW